MRFGKERAALGRALGFEGRAWRVTLAVEPYDVAAGARASGPVTRFELMVDVHRFWVVVWSKRRVFSYVKGRWGERVLAKSLRLTVPDRMDDVRPWLRRVEKKLDVTFRRDLAYAYSNVKGGKKAVLAWIAATSKAPGRRTTA